MPTPVSGTLSWQTPSTFTSVEPLSASEYDKVVQDVAFLYAKPWMFGYLNGGTSVALSTGGVNLLPSASTTVVSSTGASQFTYGGGIFSIPSGLAGLYRFTLCMTIDATGSTAHAQPYLDFGAGATSPIMEGPWIDQSTTYNNKSCYSVVLPMGTGAPFGSSVTITPMARYAVASCNAVGSTTAPTANGPTSSPPRYHTWLMCEYLGTSLGGY